MWSTDAQRSQGLFRCKEMIARAIKRQSANKNVTTSTIKSLNKLATKQKYCKQIAIESTNVVCLTLFWQNLVTPWRTYNTASYSRFLKDGKSSLRCHANKTKQSHGNAENNLFA